MCSIVAVVLVAVVLCAVDEAQHAHDEAHAGAVAQQQRLARHDVDAVVLVARGIVAQQLLHNVFALVVAVHQDEHVFKLEAIIPLQVEQVLRQELEHLLGCLGSRLVAVAWHFLWTVDAVYPHVAFQLAGLGCRACILLKVAVGCLQLFIVGETAEQFLEKGVVKLDDVFQAAVVGVEFGRVVVVLPKLFSQLILQDVGVAVAEAVDALLLVADDEVAVAFAQAIFQQWYEVLILLGACVLELVDHEIVEPRAHALVHKGYTAFECLGHKLVGVRYHDTLVVAVHLLELGADCAQQPQPPYVFEQRVEQ